MELFLKKEGSANPLWLTLACEELRVFGHYNQMDEKIMSLKDDLIRYNYHSLSPLDLCAKLVHNMGLSHNMPQGEGYSHL
jgi:hypothetical protein